MLKTNFLILFLVITLSSCAVPPVPDANETKDIRTESAGFIIVGDNIKYAMAYAIKTEFQNTLIAKVIFENPDPGGDPLVTEKLLSPGDKELHIQSPQLPGIKNNKNYKVTLKLYDGEQFIAEHENQVQFSMPTQLLRQLKERGIETY
jgi:hypothetical protein